MAVTITAPQSKVVARGSVTLTWVAGYPQSSYEILYREKGQNAWSTFGKVVSTATSVTLDLSRFTDFIEYHYRVVTYADNVTSGSSMYSGSDTSAAYSIVVVPATRVASMKVRYGTGMEEVPLYNTTNIPQRISSTNNRFGGLVDPSAANASKVKVQVNGSTKAVAKDTASFSDIGEYAHAYMNARYGYSYVTGTSYYSYYAGTYSTTGYRGPYDRYYQASGVYEGIRYYNQRFQYTTQALYGGSFYTVYYYRAIDEGYQAVYYYSWFGGSYYYSYTSSSAYYRYGTTSSYGYNYAYNTFYR